MIRYFALLIALFCRGCAFALYGGSPHTVERLRILDDRPDRYRLEVKAPGGSHYAVPADGRVIVDFPEAPKRCQQLLFGILPLNRKPGPPSLLVRKGFWSTVHRFDFYEIQTLPRDKEGYRLIALESPERVAPEIGSPPTDLPPEKLRP